MEIPSFSAIHVTDPIDISSYRMSAVEHEVERDDLVSTIELAVSDPRVSFFFVEGEDGIGKSTLISQFVRRNKENCIALFVDPINAHACREDALFLDLLQQVSFFLNGEPYVGDFERSDLIRLLERLPYQLPKKSNPIYFVLDGFESLPDHSRDILRKFIDIIPVSSPLVSMIISSNTNDLKHIVREKHRKELMVPLLSSQQLLQMLPDVTEREIEELCSVFNRHPSTISTVRRLRESGLSISEILDACEGGSESLYECEWAENAGKVEKCKFTLALMAFSNNSLSIKDLGSMLGESEEIVRGHLNELTFIRVSDEHVAFSCNGVRQYCADQLKELEHKARVGLIAFNRSRDDNLQALTSIPHYLQQEGNNEEIVQQLSNDHLARVMRLGSSVSELGRQLSFGVQSARKMNSWPTLIKFGYAKSIFSAYEAGQVQRSEIKALLRQDDVKAAIDLAVSTQIIEDRLILLASIAKHLAAEGRDVDAVLRGRIEELFESVDTEHMGTEVMVELAVELFSVFPDYAIKLINDSDQSGDSGENRSDYLFLRFSIEMLQSEDGQFELLGEKIDSLTDRKREFFSTISMFRKGTPAKSILRQLDSIDNLGVGERLLMLRNWIRAYPDESDTWSLIEAVHNLAISTSSYSVNAGFYLDMARCLPSASTKQASEFRRRVAAQVEYLESVGPTLDYVDLNLELARADGGDEEQGQKIKKLIEYIDHKVDDRSIAACAFSKLHRFFIEEGKSQYLGSVIQKKNECIAEVLSKSANHFDILKPTLAVETLIDVEKALSLAGQLNSAARRDEAICYVVEHACRNGPSINVDILCQSIRKIIARRLQGRAFLKLIAGVTSFESIGVSGYEKLRKLRSVVLDPADRCMGDCSLIALARGHDAISEEKIKNLQNEIEEEWSAIDEVPDKIDVGFRIYNRLYDKDREFAEKIRRETVRIREEHLGHSSRVLRALQDTADLTTRALKALVLADADKPSDLENVLGIIESLHGYVAKARALSRLTCIFQLEGRDRDAAQIIEGKILPIIDAVSSREWLSKQVLTWVFPVLYRYHTKIAEKRIEEYQNDTVFVEQLVALSVRYVLTGQVIGDPFDPPGRFVPELTFKDIEDVLNLVELQQSDSETCHALIRIGDFCCKNRKSHKMTQMQVNLIADRVRRIIEDYLEKSNYISHNGYAICARAIEFEIRNEKGKAAWEGLVAECRRIDNDADRAFVLVEVAKRLPTKFRALQSELFNESSEIVDSLPSDLDRLDRYDFLASRAMRIDKKFAKDVVSRAVQLSSANEVDGFEERRSHLIDTAYAIDEDFPATLLALTDKEPARLRSIAESVEEKKKEREREREFRCGESKEESFGFQPDYPRYAWRNVGKINGNSFSAKEIRDSFEFLAALEKYDFEDCYPLLSYYISSVSMKSKSVATAEEYIRPIFDSLLSTYALQLAVYAIDAQRVPSSSGVGKSNVLVGAGEIDRASTFVHDWLIENEVSSVTIIDPYFTLEDLEFVGECIDRDPNFQIRLLSSMQKYDELTRISDNNLDEIIYDYWRDNISSAAPPGIKFVFAGVKALNGGLPIHDRWWLTGTTGLRFGGSINGIGNRISEISIINEDELINIESQVMGFVNETQREFNGERVRFMATSI